MANQVFSSIFGELTRNIQARIDKVVIGSMNPKAGCAGSVLNLFEVDAFNHQVELETGVMQEECTELLQTFFKEVGSLCNIRIDPYADLQALFMEPPKQSLHVRKHVRIPFKAAPFIFLHPEAVEMEYG